MKNATAKDNAQNPDIESGEKAEANSKKKSEKDLNTSVNNPHEVLLHKDIRVFSDEPLPHLDKGPIKAYRGIGSNKFSSDLCVYLCHKSLTPRRIESVKYSKLTNPNLVNLEYSGKVVWPGTGDERFCLVYTNTLGVPLLDKKEQNPALGWDPDDTLNNVVYPLLETIIDMHNKALIYGEIWPGNMLYNGKSSAEKVELGECLTAPISSQLPALYEPIERALADPVGRGIGTIEDDLYSFGASLAVILRTVDPMKNASDDDIIEMKIEKGSYATLLGSYRLKGAMLELLRGLLYDDPEQRWNLEDIQSWMDGRRLSPKQSPRRVKAIRPIDLGDKKYIRLELFSKDMWLHTDEAAKLIENGVLDQWLDRAIDDVSVKVRLDQAMKDIEAYDRGGDYNDRLCVGVSTTLYTECPIRYKGLSFIPYGFGSALTLAYVSKKNLQPFVDVLKHSFVMQSIRYKKNVDTSALIARFDSCRTFISQNMINSGLERCIYFLDPETPCLSPILDKYYVHAPEDIMDAFEGICSSSKPTVLFDRHVVSFLSIKDRKNIDPYMSDLKSEEPHRRALGQIRTLATIQKRCNLGKFPAITTWFSKNLEELYGHFHDAEKQAKLKKKVNALRGGGDLTRLALLFDDPNLYQKDVGAFFQAMGHYGRLENEKSLIEGKLTNRKNYGQRTGRQMASVISMVLSIVIIVISAYSKFF